MAYLLMGFICATLGVVPSLFYRRIKLSAILFVTYLFSATLLFWAEKADIVGPYFGHCILMAVLLSFISIIWCLERSDYGIVYTKKDKIASLTHGLICIGLLISLLFGAKMFRSQEYASMIGPVEMKVWTQDVQPKNAQHIRLVNYENANFRAQNSLKGDIGAQFEVFADLMTLQVIDNKLWYIAPLDFKSLGAWRMTAGVPGYIKISAEDDDYEPELVMLPKGKEFSFTPGAYFNNNLERHLRFNGYLNIGLCDYSLEVDEYGAAWWVVTTYQPVIWNGGKKVTGVVIVDPVTGQSTHYAVDKIPSWVDRVMPIGFVEDYLTWWGKYRNGFMNTMPIIGSGEGMVKPLSVRLFYGSDGRPYLVADITSSGRDSSLVGMFYVDSRNGKAIFYKTDGGSIADTIVESINKNPQVQYLHLHADIPQLYNLYGRMASISLLLNGQHSRQGVAIVDVKDVGKVAVGNTLSEAVSRFQEIIGQHEKGAIDKSYEVKTISGVVDRIFHESVSVGSAIHQIHLEGVPHIFYGTKQLSVKLPMTEKGDEVKISYVATDEASVPMKSFDNKSLLLSYSKLETELTREANSNKKKSEIVDEQRTLLEKVKSLSPEEMRELKKNIPDKK